VRKAGKREDRKPDSLLEAKGRAAKEPEDGPRQACCPLPKPPQQTHGLRVLFSQKQVKAERTVPFLERQGPASLRHLRKSSGFAHGNV